jgi:chromosome segregation ATPase
MTNEADLEKEADEDLVELAPVPDDDIAKHARPKCTTCYGRGKFSIRLPVTATQKTVVCQCALKRFVAVNRERLSVGKDRQLYYRKMPEVAIEEISETTESGESDSARPTGDGDRLQVMRERIVSLDEKIAEIDERYDRQLEPLSADFNAAEQILGEERAKSREMSAQLSSLSSQIDAAARDIELLETRLHKAKGNRENLLQIHAETAERQSREEARPAPFVKDLEDARAAVFTLNKKRHQAQTPHRQRRESLVKRLAHKAAGLGLSQDGQPAAGDEAAGSDRG